MDRQPMNTRAPQKLEGWIMAQCYRLRTGGPAPPGWIEPRGKREWEWPGEDRPVGTPRPLVISEILLNYFKLEPSRTFHSGGPTNECFPDTPRFREAIALCNDTIAALLAEGVLVRAPSGGHRLADSWVERMSGR